MKKIIYVFVMAMLSASVFAIYEIDSKLRPYKLPRYSDTFLYINGSNANTELNLGYNGFQTYNWVNVINPSAWKMVGITPEYVTFLGPYGDPRVDLSLDGMNFDIATSGDINLRRLDDYTNWYVNVGDNLNVGGNLYVEGCICYNGGETCLGECV